MLAPSGPRRAAMTLIELMVVIAIAVIILGAGVGVYGTMQGRFEFNRVRSELAGAFRQARTNALEHNDRVQVDIDPQAGSVHTTLRELLGSWQFEPEDQLMGLDGPEYRGAYNFNAQTWETYSLGPTVGRFGGAVYFPFRDEAAHGQGLEEFVEPKPRLEIPDTPYWNPISGVRIEMYVYLEQFWQVYQYRIHEDREWLDPDRTPFNSMRYRLFKKDRGYTLSVRVDGSLLLEVAGLDAQGDSQSAVFFTASRAVPEVRWFRLVFELVSGWPRLLVDGVPLQLLPANAAARDFAFDRFPLFDEPFLIGHEQLHQRLAGAIDGLRIYGFRSEQSFSLPGGFKMLGTRQRVVFSGDGFLDPLVHSSPVTVRLADDEAFLFDQDSATAERETPELLRAREETTYFKLHDADKREVTIELSGGVR